MLHHYITAPQHRCTTTPLHHYTTTPLHHYTTTPLHHYTTYYNTTTFGQLVLNGATWMRAPPHGPPRPTSRHARAYAVRSADMAGLGPGAAQSSPPYSVLNMTLLALSTNRHLSEMREQLNQTQARSNHRRTRSHQTRALFIRRDEMRASSSTPMATWTKRSFCGRSACLQ